MVRRPSANFELPRALLETAKREMGVVSNERLFNSSKHEKMREKWCAGMLGLGYEKCVRPCRVAVNESEQRKDVDLFLETEDRECDPDDARHNGPRWIANRIAQKIGKRYAGASDLNLLVCANFTARQLQHAEVVATARPHLSAFASVWVVTSLWLGALSVANDLGRIDGWGIIFAPEQYAADQAG